MKWNSKGHEIDTYASEICNILTHKDGITIYGAGNVGTRIGRILKRYHLFRGYVDNDINKQKRGFKEDRVYSSEILVHTKTFVVVATMGAYKEISGQLQKFGMVEYKDFICADVFENKWLPILLYYQYNHLYTNLAQICVTERCTLKCKKCAHACNMVDINAEDMLLDKAKKSADEFFDKYDCVGEFVLIGGEPLLYKSLPALIRYIGEKYRDKMIVFSITTNGTIIPSDELIKECGEYGVTIRVSDYSKSIPRLKSNYQNLYKKLKVLSTEVWYTNANNSWFDYGFDRLDEKKDIRETEKTFNQCMTQCREINGSKYYFCVMAHTVAKNRKYNIGQNDYIDLSTVLDKKILLEFELGYSEKGYLDMCRICRGKAAEKYLIPAAEQENS